MTRRPEIPFDVVPCTDGKSVNVTPMAQSESSIGITENLTVEQAIYLADRLVDAVTGRVHSADEIDVLEELARRVGLARGTGWTDAPEAVPRIAESTAISVRFPTKMLPILKEFARREDVGYQVLMKRWLDERIKVEGDKVKAAP